MSLTDEYWMRQALQQAQLAFDAGEAPIGCVIVKGNAMVGSGYNLRESNNDPTAHAEIVALKAAGETLGSWKLTDCTMYVTLEPCTMCAGALVNSRIPKLVYGCDDPRAGAVRTLYAICEDPRLNHRLDVVRGVLGQESSALLKTFFRQLREQK